MKTDIRLAVVGTGMYVPDEVVGNNYFVDRDLNRYDRFGTILETRRLTEDGIVKVTGIRERRRAAAGETPSDLGYRAAVAAIENAGINADSIVGIIFSSVTEDTNVPSAACKVQKRLGVRNCFAYDLANACAGFPEALAQANARALRRPGHYLVIGAECLTNMVDYTDINSTLFGDGAGAAVLGLNNDGLGIVAEYSVSDPFDGKADYIFRDSKRILQMPEGESVLREAVRGMLESVEDLKRQTGWECADVIIPHQANLRIINKIAKRATDSHVFVNIEKYGNMSTATCAIGLHEAREQGLIRDGSRVIVTSFGAGLSTAAVAMQF